MDRPVRGPRLRTSLTIAVVSAVIATVLGTLSAIAMDRLRRTPASGASSCSSYVAIIVPGIVIGISTLIFAVTAFDSSTRLALRRGARRS